MKKKFNFLTVTLILLAVLSFSFCAHAQEKVRLQLKWRHAFQFAGYYTAVEKGFYKDAGLEVEIIEGTPKTHTTEEVLSGRAQYGVGTSSLILERKAGKPVVVIANIFQHSPQVLIARKFSENQSIHDLIGRRLMLEPQSEELLAYLKAEGVPLSSIRIQPHSFSIDDLRAQRTDVISAYSISEPFHLTAMSVPFQVFTPRSAGIDFYGDNLFTSETEIAQHPERVRAFLRASLKGWEYALTHQNEIIDVILKKYPVGSGELNSSAFLNFEAKEVASLMRSDLVAVGYMNSGRWRAIADIYAGLEMLPENFPLEGFLYELEGKDASDKWQISRAFIASLLVIFVALIFTAYVFHINRKLKRTIDELREHQSKLHLLSVAIEHSPAPTMITGPDTSIEYVNPEFTRETGYSLDEIVGRTPKILKSGLTSAETYRLMWDSLLAGRVWSGELINRRKSGEIYWEEAHIAPVFNSSGTLTNYVAVKRDITERKIASEKLAHLAHHDSLTDLPNRVLFFERVRETLKSASIHNRRVALLFIDLDKFKPVNDTHGHAFGDLILQEAAKRMCSTVRDSDMIGRIGGDEFVGLLPHLFSEEDAVLVARKLCDALNQPFRVGEMSKTLGASIGIAFYPEHGEDERTLAKSADIAMYYAKQSDAGGICIFSEEMRGRYPFKRENE